MSRQLWSKGTCWGPAAQHWDSRLIRGWRGLFLLVAPYRSSWSALVLVLAVFSLDYFRICGLPPSSQTDWMIPPKCYSNCRNPATSLSSKSCRSILSCLWLSRSRKTSLWISSPIADPFCLLVLEPFELTHLSSALLSAAIAYAL